MAQSTWQTIPEMDFYLDQVLVLVNTTIQPFTKDTLTASMVNNYVKHAYLSKPIKKRYTKKHILQLIVIMILKQAFSLQAIHQGIHIVLAEFDQHTAFERFYHYLTNVSTQQETLSITTPAEKLLYEACQTIAYQNNVLALLHDLEVDTHG